MLYVGALRFQLTVPDMTAWNNDTDSCGAEFQTPDEYWTCTLISEHDGAHIAGDGDTTLAIWTDSDIDDGGGLFIRGIKTNSVVIFERGSDWDNTYYTGGNEGCGEHSVNYNKYDKLFCTSHVIAGHHCAIGDHHVMAITEISEE